MKTIKLALEYGAWPLWILDEKGQVIDTVMPEEWADQKDLEPILDELQRLYESQFVNDGKVFTNKGFGSKDEEAKYDTLLEEARKRIAAIIPTGYEFIDGTVA